MDNGKKVFGARPFSADEALKVYIYIILKIIRIKVLTSTSLQSPNSFFLVSKHVKLCREYTNHKCNRQFVRG